GALAAAKLQIKIAHIEAGLRSFNRAMPEEINRVLTDHVSQLLFCPTETAITNLANEGITQGVYHVGDVMADALLEASTRAANSQVLTTYGLTAKGYLLATIHRPANTDNHAALSGILAAFAQLPLPIILPIHPRLKAMLDHHGLQLPQNVQVIPPVGYLSMAALLG